MARIRREIEVPRDWETFAWSGFRVRVPRDWTPAALTGNEDDGYFRLDGPDQPRLEVKWASSRGFVDVEKVVARYLNSMRKGRAGQEVQVDERPALRMKLGKERSSLRFFGWRSDQEALGAAWFCRDCGRTTLVQVLGPPGSDVVTLAEQILTTLEDHTTGPWVNWALYGFRCQVPAGFKLVGQELLTGLLRLNFEHGREKLAIVRWGLADVALQGTDLESFLYDKNKKNWRHFRLKTDVADVHGHEGALALSGISAMPFAHMAGVALRLIGRRWANNLRGAAWLCEPTNKIYHVEAVVDPSDEGMVAEVIDRIHCHEGRAATSWEDQAS